MEPDVVITIKWYKKYPTHGREALDVTATVPDKKFVCDLLKTAFYSMENSEKRLVVIPKDLILNG